jgi:hypothetical protein
MIRTGSVLILVVLAAQAAGLALHAQTEAPASPPAQSGEIDVNPYGDPSWDVKPAPPKARRHVERAHGKPHHAASGRAKARTVARSAHAEPHGYARATELPARRVKRTAIGRPLNIVPPAARAN